MVDCKPHIRAVVSIHGKIQSVSYIIKLPVLNDSSFLREESMLLTFCMDTCTASDHRKIH